MTSFVKREVSQCKKASYLMGMKTSQHWVRYTWDVSVRSYLMGMRKISIGLLCYESIRPSCQTGPDQTDKPIIKNERMGQWVHPSVIKKWRMRQWVHPSVLSDRTGSDTDKSQKREWGNESIRQSYQTGLYQSDGPVTKKERNNGTVSPSFRLIRPVRIGLTDQS